MPPSGPTDGVHLFLLTGFAHIPLLIRSLLLFLFLRGGHGENLINFYLSGHYFFQAVA